MNQSLTCDTCGNPVPAGEERCPYCERPLRVRERPSLRAPLLSTVNLKEGLPTAREACRRLRVTVARERRRGVRVLKVIHGYGSSGKGGRIRDEVRKLLEGMTGRGEVAGFLHGEDFRRQSGRARDLVRRFPELKEDPDFGRGNRGVTLVVLS
jgi:hypothetical protein